MNTLVVYFLLGKVYTANNYSSYLWLRNCIFKPFSAILLFLDHCNGVFVVIDLDVSLVIIHYNPGYLNDIVGCLGVDLVYCSLCLLCAGSLDWFMRTELFNNLVQIIRELLRKVNIQFLSMCLAYGTLMQ